tara:strand:- start:114 stop:464 length:351 start_codon:yes stop_codon:yes gene_type:complete
MLKITNTNTRKETCNFAKTVTKFTEYVTNGNVQLAGDSIWGYNGSNTVDVSAILVIETTYTDSNETYTMVNVTHNATWDIYTDSAFENAISNVVNFNVSFTEQGMQENGYASLEAA